MVNRVRENEDDKVAFAAVSSGIQMQNLQEKQATAGAGAGGGSNNHGGSVIQQGLRAAEYVNFKLPKDLTLLNRDGVNVLCYSKPSTYEQ